MNVLLVAVGGFFGSMLRFYVSQRIQKHLLGTMVANITGSIFLAWMMLLYLDGTISKSIWLLTGIGFSGAYTTFSTFSNETLNLIRDHHYWQAIGYIVTSLGSAILLVFLVFKFF